MPESSESDYQTIENLHILQKYVDRVLPPPVKKDISCHNAATLFLHWLIKYWPEREYGELFFPKNQL